MNLYEILLKQPRLQSAYWKVVGVGSNDPTFYEKLLLLLVRAILHAALRSMEKSSSGPMPIGCLKQELE